ncbi:ZrgA family zinc uptake protein [Amphritea japonica]|uniref:ABC transporter substrate-binding protein n=1 Tax=Amphritea japonica ATCC BAA-1530 TaxID=1278309 RepID=A0A7R6PA95_9GAMM|nr:DUF2796 domain-containing protein [Amphritea japonica]BBB25748.1 ABC transporter substrate-binding protein [Amphritea japonica ATCC BAA-1530]
MKLLVGVVCALAASVAGAEGIERQLESHEHGKASMNVVLAGQVLEIEIKTPAANILGFEHQPETGQQKQALAAAVAQLNAPEGFIRLADEADCQLSGADVDSALLAQAYEEEGEHHHDDHDEEGHHDEESHHDDHDEEGHHDAEHEGHTDFELSYQFKCQKPEALSGFSLELFQQYPLMKQLEVQAISPAGQSYQKLDVDNHWVNF